MNNYLSITKSYKIQFKKLHLFELQIRKIHFHNLVFRRKEWRGITVEFL